MTCYTYLIGWSKHNKWYYGVRYAKLAKPEDLFVTYFTSSRYVKNFIKENGTPDIIQIRKVFENVEAALKWEAKVITRLGIVKRKDFLNRTDNKAIPPWAAGHSKGKTYEEIYGHEKAKIMKEVRSTTGTGRKWRLSDSVKNKNKDRHKGSKNPKAIKIKILIVAENKIYEFGQLKECRQFLKEKFDGTCYYSVLRRKLQGFNKAPPNYCKLDPLYGTFEILK